MHSGGQNATATISHGFEPFAMICTYAKGVEFVQSRGELSIFGHSNFDSRQMGNLQVKKRDAQGALLVVLLDAAGQRMTE
jgi:hypothetical protein